MENKIPTAEEVWAKNTDSSINQEEYSAMIEFAKIHVKAALTAASEITHKNGIPRIVDDQNSILCAYPLNQIK